MTPKMMFAELVISLAFWAAVLGVPGWLAWRHRAQLLDGIISVLATGERARRRIAAGAKELRRRIDERAG